jgi:hypothetical protein
MWCGWRSGYFLQDRDEACGTVCVRIRIFTSILFFMNPQCCKYNCLNVVVMIVWSLLKNDGLQWLGRASVLILANKLLYDTTTFMAEILGKAGLNYVLRNAAGVRSIFEGWEKTGLNHRKEKMQQTKMQDYSHLQYTLTVKENMRE